MDGPAPLDDPEDVLGQSGRSADITELIRLAGLDPLAYDRERAAAAEHLGIRQPTLDAEVVRLRAIGQKDSSFDDARPPAFTDEALALQFSAEYADRLRYVAAWGRWLLWESVAWRFDETLRALDMARVICRQASGDCNDPRVASNIASAKTVAAVERLAKADRRHAATVDQWDCDPWLLNTPDGVVDLRNGTVRRNRPNDYQIKISSVAAAQAQDCDLWLAFLNQATNQDSGLIRFLQQWCGYCLTGDTREHSLLFVHGPGGNGKGVFLKTISGILGTYARTAAMDTFVASTGDRHPTELAALRGARMVTASETEEGRAWAEARIKALTGGDTIAARFVKQDFFEFTPEFKLTIVGNHQPMLRNVDEAARRRLNVVPFNHKPDVVDRQLEVRLRDEWPGILRWMIEGCLDWQKNGLVRPDVVVDATQEYFSEQDVVAQWIQDCCLTGATQSDTVAALFQSWTNYAEASGEKAGKSKWFSQTLVRLGFEPVKSTPGERGKRGFKGIGLIRTAARSFHDAEQM